MAATLLRLLLLQALYKPCNQDKREQKIFLKAIPPAKSKKAQLSQANLSPFSASHSGTHIRQNADQEKGPDETLPLLAFSHHCYTSRVSLPGQKSHWSKKTNLHTHVQVVRVRHVVHAYYWGSSGKQNRTAKAS